MESTELAWRLFSISTTGFFFLIGGLWWVARQLPDAKRIAEDLTDIRNALLGTMQKEGYITKLSNLVREVEIIKKKVNAHE